MNTEEYVDYIVELIFEKMEKLGITEFWINDMKVNYEPSYIIQIEDVKCYNITDIYDISEIISEIIKND